MYKYDYPRPAVTVDAILFSKKNDELEILLIQRKNPPFQYYWAFPGGFVNEDENLKEAVLRELKEETSIENIDLKQLKTFGKVKRDPRGRTISVVYFSFVEKEKISPKANDDAMNLKWVPVKNIKKLAFDHKEILNFALKNLKKTSNF